MIKFKSNYFSMKIKDNKKATEICMKVRPSSISPSVLFLMNSHRNHYLKMSYRWYQVQYSRRILRTQQAITVPL